MLLGLASHAPVPQALWDGQIEPYAYQPMFRGISLMSCLNEPKLTAQLINCGKDDRTGIGRRRRVDATYVPIRLVWHWRPITLEFNTLGRFTTGHKADGVKRDLSNAGELHLNRRTGPTVRGRILAQLHNPW